MKNKIVMTLPFFTLMACVAPMTQEFCDDTLPQYNGCAYGQPIFGGASDPSGESNTEGGQGSNTGRGPFGVSPDTGRNGPDVDVDTGDSGGGGSDTSSPGDVTGGISGKGQQGNNGHGNGDQDAPGNSGGNNNAENSENSGKGNSGRGKGKE